MNYALLFKPRKAEAFLHFSSLEENAVVCPQAYTFLFSLLRGILFTTLSFLNSSLALTPACSFVGDRCISLLTGLPASALATPYGNLFSTQRPG